MGEEYVIKVLGAEYYAFEISFTNEYGDIIHQIEDIKAGAATHALKLYLQKLKSEMNMECNNNTESF